MTSFLNVVRTLGLLFARLGLGGIMLLHGWRRWQERGVPAEIEYLQQFGAPYPEIAAWGTIILELVGGLFMIVGALTPLVALAFLVQQIMTISYTRYFNGPYLLEADGTYVGGYEYNVALGLLALIFVVFGAGRVSIDGLFRRSKDPEDDFDNTEDTPTSGSSAA